MTKTFAFSTKDGAFLGYVDKEMDMLRGLPDPSTVKPGRRPFTVIGIGFGGSRGRRCSVCGSRPAPNNIDYKPFCDSCLQKYWDQQARRRR
jgi:hypothetical protein